ncbi:copper-binding protein [Roseibium sediminicola]|uniref:Copper-binding protein n=1 Tax=Roseibium sediminicola TaxID=2933272 RepID=A0ABT0GWA5_9HYPH|nr:copper-binding protein [Roseibium sp. CAU 1639]MCK7613732.1 copper-binding protein [Roseibium sp. CAU 1639]
MKPVPIFLAAVLAGLLTIVLSTPSRAGLHRSANPVAVQLPPENMYHAELERIGAQLFGAIHLRAVINSLSEGAVNVSHEANPAIGWPAMTMDLPLAPYAKIAPGIGAGHSVTLMLTLGDQGSYRVAAIFPAATPEPLVSERDPCERRGAAN